MVRAGRLSNGLTPMQDQVARLKRQYRMTNAMIARQLHITPSTVEQHVSAIYRFYNVTCVTELRVVYKTPQEAIQRAYSDSIAFI